LLSIKKSGDVVNKTSKKKYYDIEATFSKKIVLKKKKKKRVVKNPALQQDAEVADPGTVFGFQALLVVHTAQKAS
jgi:hypothetical protein